MPSHIVNCMHNHVALLTDYGLDDEFVGVLKSVITDMAPHVRITDITHGVPPFDVRWGSLALARAVQYVPAGVIVAVVDDGIRPTHSDLGANLTSDGYDFVSDLGLPGCTGGTFSNAGGQYVDDLSIDTDDLAALSSSQIAAHTALLFMTMI